MEAEIVDRSPQTTLESLNDPFLSSSVEMQDADLSRRSEEPQLIAIVRLLWPRRVRLGKASLAGLILASIVAVLIPNTYQTTVRLMPPDNSFVSGSSSSALLGLVLGGPNAPGGSSGGGLSGAVGDLLGTQKPGPLFIGIVSGRTVADGVIDGFDLRKVYGIKTYAATRKKLLSRVNFVEDKKSGIISITVDDRDPVRVVAMAQAFVDQVNRLLSHVNNSASSRERQFLEKRIADINVELADATKKLSDFSSRNATFDPEDQGKAMLDSAAILEGQLIAAKSELGGLQEIYTSENVRVRSLQAHISELEKQLNAFGGKGYTGSTTLDPNSLYPSVRQLPVLGREYAELYRRAKVDEAVFTLLTESYELAKVQEAKDTPSVKVLDAPRLPERPDWPPRSWLALGGALLGFLFAAGWILWAQHWASVDPNAPYKALLNREILPALRNEVASIRRGGQRLLLRFRRPDQHQSV
jgi:capsule polysaccharide export protein KpsE/RkpR